jgi:hypothetical protein
MSREALERFAELIMTRVRDAAIEQWQLFLDGRMKGPSGTRVRRQLEGLSQEQIAMIRDKLMPDIIDTSLHYLFWLLDGFDHVVVQFDDGPGPHGDIIDRDDSLQNRLYGDAGWIRRFSRQPYDNHDPDEPK